MIVNFFEGEAVSASPLSFSAMNHIKFDKEMKSRGCLLVRLFYYLWEYKFENAPPSLS